MERGGRRRPRLGRADDSLVLGARREQVNWRAAAAAGFVGVARPRLSEGGRERVRAEHLESGRGERGRRRARDARRRRLGQLLEGRLFAARFLRRLLTIGGGRVLIDFGGGGAEGAHLGGEMRGALEAGQARALMEQLHRLLVLRERPRLVDASASDAIVVGRLRVRRARGASGGGGLLMVV